MDKRRVVVTGLGAVTPLGNNVETLWDGISQGKSGIGPITLFDTTDFKVKIAGEVKDFDFSKYQAVEVIGYSAGVFVASIIADRIPNLKHKIALNGNPYLFDEKKGLSSEIVNTFKQITMDNYLDFRREYMVDSDEEFELYNQLQSERSLESCQSELQKLQEFYQRYAGEINPVFDKAIISEHDKIFNFKAQQDFYGDKLYVLPESKHHVFFKFKSFEDILKIEIDEKNTYQYVIESLKKGLGNCFEESKFAELIAKINGQNNIYSGKIYAGKGFAKHEVAFITDIKINADKFYRFKNKEAIILDPWLGITDYAENYFTRITKNYGKILGIKSYSKPKLQPDLSGKISARKLAEYKKNHPELIIKNFKKIKV